MIARRTAAIALSFAFLAAPVQAQYSVGVGVDYLSYDFEEGLGADAATLLMMPVAVRVPVTNALTFDVYSAWAEGRVTVADSTLSLSGPVDTGVRAAYQVTPWALLTVGANIPTGNAEHDDEEAVVASILSTDLLGFRESTWGRGFAVTSSLAVARNVGGFGLGLAAAYSLRGKFSPSAAQELEYQPGSERRVRIGIDRNFGNSTLTLGGTFINYASDQADGQNLFQAGNRFRVDATYAFRMSGGVWTIYAADLVRQNGDRFATGLNLSGDTIDVTIPTPRQNLLVGGLTGSVSLGGGFVFRPHLDFKYQTREDAAGSDAGSGWLFAGGGDIPVRIFGGQDFFPKARVLLGSIQDATGASIGVFGLEFKGTLRINF